MRDKIECEDDRYAARLKAYYDNATKEMLAEERMVAEKWGMTDALLPPEESRW